jgi:SAM-dependent methyltransferase
MKFKEQLTCPICNEGISKEKGLFNDMLYGHKGEWKILKCNNCLHESISPFPSFEFLESLYKVNSYYSFGTSRLNGISKFIRKKSRRLLPNELKNKRFLDYGCGDGEVLLIAKNKGADVFGLEFGDAVNILKINTGLDIRDNPPTEWYGTMDYVRSFHSFEHIVNPLEVLELFKDLILPNSGKILIGVPNVDSFTANLFGKFYFYRGAPLHLHGYSVKSITHLAESLGLEVLSIKTPGGFRGVLGSINIFFQYLFTGKSREPSTLSLLAMFPLYLLLFPFVKVTNLFLKGDVLEITLKRADV